MKLIDEKISAIEVELVDYAQSLKFEELCEFSIPVLENIP